MPKQTIEVIVDVPDGWEATGEYRPVCPGENYAAYPGVAAMWCSVPRSADPLIILRRKEPVRESRWRFVPTMHGSPCYSYLYPTLVDARKALGCNHNGVYTHIERLDFENNKLVAVTLEPQ